MRDLRAPLPDPRPGPNDVIIKVHRCGICGTDLSFTRGAMFDFGKGQFGHEYAGEIKNRGKGVLIAMEECTTVAYALFNLQERGRLFLGPGEKVYTGQIIGEHSREADIIVNPSKGKKLTNMRASTSDATIILRPPRILSLDQAIEFIAEDELVEVTPQSVRLRKMELDATRRQMKARKED